MPEYIYEMGSVFPIVAVTEAGLEDYILSYDDVRDCIPRYYFEVPIS